MKLTGIVTNVTNFGAFVDIGVHQDGLVHVSEISDKFISNPADLLKVGQKVQVSVVEVDMARKRISLSMRSKPREPGLKDKSSPGQPKAKTVDNSKHIINQNLGSSNKRKPLYDF